MLSFKRTPVRHHRRSPSRPETGRVSLRQAREYWSILMETLDLRQKTVYALSFHRRGSAVYYQYKHCYDRSEANEELTALRGDLEMELHAFEEKYQLDAF